VMPHKSLARQPTMTPASGLIARMARLGAGGSTNSRVIS
jgi:hypothetical protein